MNEVEIIKDEVSMDSMIKILKSGSPLSVYYYTTGQFKGRWPEAESIIMKSPVFAYLYAKDVIGDRWPEAESVIMKKPHVAFEYATNVIGERWPEAEGYIMKDSIYWGFYKRHFNIQEQHWLNRLFK